MKPAKEIKFVKSCKIIDQRATERENVLKIIMFTRAGRYIVKIDPNRLNSNTVKTVFKVQCFCYMKNNGTPL